MRLPSVASPPAEAATAAAFSVAPTSPATQPPHLDGAFLASPHSGLSPDPDPWAPDPVLDRNLVTGPAGGPAGHDAEAEAAAGAATALHESGFGGALHTALGELRRITDDPVPVPAGAVASSSEAQATRPKGQSAPVPGSGPDWPSTRPRSIAAIGRGAPGEWLASLGDWWTMRWRELLPGLVVVTLVIVAFAVVLASGGRRANTSHVDTRRPIASDPPTTIAGLFTTASAPPGDSPPPGDVPPSSPRSSDGHNPSPAIAPVTTKPSSSGADTPSAPTMANPSSTGTPSSTAPANTTPPRTDPPATGPPPTDPPPTTSPTTEPTTVPTTPPSTIDICAVRPSHC